MEASFLENYLLRPESFWPKSHLRNADKVKRFVATGCAANGQNPKSYIDDIIKLGQLRKRFDNKHVYIVNPGSSGSHWIEAMLSLLADFHNGGEIYLPKDVKEYLSTLQLEDAEFFLDVVYLVHAGGIFDDSLTASLSNSAHLANHQQLSQFSPNKRVVLLLRNPVDVVMSRTFRKDEYKKDIAPNSCDKEYLERNCSYVEKFYANINYDSFDSIIKYEDFENQPLESLKALADIIGLKASDQNLMNAVNVTSRKAVKDSVSKGEQAMTNVYLGKHHEHAWAKDYTVKRLSYILNFHGMKFD
ncbi:sulfotransferase domain-containing protein [Halomonas sp. HP20-15]|uniref:sulfotransferase domain-containing protein n=1 Tax=Halomonas sp. HP20-15 TaxID=3085901 RepID=UPI0029822318|nr:sulfotransferase domain-containing protein [Halomonas sp. HP20-15]MDW5378855.1 sulfotransferase domain-containing protein [Halomonas sp. HP20-15]